MNALASINRLLLVLLSFSTAAVKFARMPEEMALFANASFGEPATVAFGGAQFVGALLLLHNKTVRVGAAWMAVTFVLATGVVFLNQMWVFGVSSLIFVAMAGGAYMHPGFGYDR